MTVLGQDLAANVTLQRLGGDVGEARVEYTLAMQLVLIVAAQVEFESKVSMWCITFKFQLRFQGGFHPV